VVREVDEYMQAILVELSDRQNPRATRSPRFGVIENAVVMPIADHAVAQRIVWIRLEWFPLRHGYP
jgi:hypothetical protein